MEPYYWSTINSHYDNIQTMDDWIENHMPHDFTLIYEDGTYAEVLDELGVLDHTVGVASVGCSVFSYEYSNCDMQQAAHGRACAVATGIKLVISSGVIITPQAWVPVLRTEPSNATACVHGQAYQDSLGQHQMHVMVDPIHAKQNL